MTESDHVRYLLLSDKIKDRYMNYFDFTITKSSIDNGRIYFDAIELNFFPDDATGGRSGDELAINKIVIHAAGQVIETDIRFSSNVRLSPRKSFRKWMRSQQVLEGGRARLHRVADRSYNLEYLG